jgi:hypothetical protein
MSIFQAFRRQPVPSQMAQQLRAVTLPAPTRGIILSENYAYMQPGGCMVCDNWRVTMRGIQLRSGSIRWCDLFDNGVDPPPPLEHPSRKPIISAFEYASGNEQKMFAATEDSLFDVSFAGTATLVKSGQASGNYCASQMETPAGDYLLALNQGGDYPLRFDGTSWHVLDPTLPVPPDILITGPADTTVEHGRNLVYVWKYANRWFFIEGGSMTAWYLDINAIGGELQMIPLSGAANRGGKLLFGATWTIDAGDGLDDKCCFVTDQGEVLIFSGSNPSDAANWRQEGRYQIPPPMGINAHTLLGGDLLVATVQGIVPLSAAITKDAGQLELTMLTVTIKPMWRSEVLTKTQLPWTMCRWDEYGGMFVTWPGGPPGNRYCATVNTATGAWMRYVGWDATCFIRMRADMFFGTQNGIVMQADRTGYDDGLPYTAVLVGGWEMFQSPSQTCVWHQARASFVAAPNSPFRPQISACTDYVVKIPQPPVPGPDPGVNDVWDEGLWDEALWDQDAPSAPMVQNTGWVSIGATGFSHAPVLQVMVGQRAPPNVELVSIAATFEVLGVNV